MIIIITIVIIIITIILIIIIIIIMSQWVQNKGGLVRVNALPPGPVQPTKVTEPGSAT